MRTGPCHDWNEAQRQFYPWTFVGRDAHRLMAYIRESSAPRSWPLSWLLETETRSKNVENSFFCQAHDSENRAAHLHQEFLGVFITLTHMSCYIVTFWYFFPYLEPISTVFTNIVRILYSVRSPRFIPSPFYIYTQSVSSSPRFT